MPTAAAAPMPIPAPAPAERPEGGDAAEDVFAGGAFAVGEVSDTVADPGPEVGVTVAESADEMTEEPEAVALASMADESMDQ
jgi:hypothetical protein